MEQVDELVSSVRALRPFVPAGDFATSKQFYADLGFRVEALGMELAQVSLGEHSFLLQDYYIAQWAENFVIHVLVTNLNGWWKRIDALDLVRRYSVESPRAPRLEPWGLNVAYVSDPSGVLWHFAERPAPSAAGRSA
jgi:hypothetical protein